MNTDQKANPVDRITTGLNSRVILYGIIILLTVGAGYLLYRNWQLARQVTAERDTLYIKAQNNQLDSDRQQLMFGMKTLAWAVGYALAQNKEGEINAYFNTLVRDRGVKEMLLVDPSGTVRISTNKKNQGIPFANRFPANLLQQDEVYFTNQEFYQLSAPVMAPDKRLGTLVMIYTPAPILPDLSTDK
jgi:hypothetical protein